MTRKQYEGKMRQFQHNCHKQAKINGMPMPHYVDRINRPNFGWKDHTGKTINSYAEFWDVMVSVIKGTPLMEGIEA